MRPVRLMPPQRREAIEAAKQALLAAHRLRAEGVTVEHKNRYKLGVGDTWAKQTD